MVNENRFAGVILNIALSPLILRKSSRTVRRREGILKKSAVIIIVAITAVFALTALVACVNTDLSGIGFAQGFEDTLSCFDFTLSEEDGRQSNVLQYIGAYEKLGRFSRSSARENALEDAG